MENITIPTATPDSVWALLQEIAKRQAETDLQIAKTSRQIEKTDKQISRLEKQVGGISNNNGAFAEEYFVNSLRKGDIILFGEKFDKLIKSVIMIDDKDRIRGEIDTLLINGKAVAILETKYRARENNIDHALKKVKIFRDRFPEYANHKLYLGIASMVFDANVEEKCIENGIAIIKQVGDNIVVYDENLKTF